MKRGLNIWDIIAWVCVIGIFLWLVLKVAGVINTPILLEYAPYFGATYIAGWLVHELKDNSKKLNSLEKLSKLIT